MKVISSLLATSIVLALSLSYTAIVTVGEGIPATTTTTLPEYCGIQPGIPLPDFGFLGSDVTTPTLRQVTVLARHGDRTQISPDTCWDGDVSVFQCKGDTLYAYSTVASIGLGDVPPRMFRRVNMDGRTDLKGNCNTGELTDIGYEQEMNNGRVLRNFYIDHMKFLPQSYEEDSESFFFRSDDSPRVIKSGQAIIEGLYPITRAPSSQTTYDVIPWYLVELDIDNINANNFKICPGLKEEISRVEGEEEYQRRNNEVVKPLLQQLSYHTGRDYSMEWGIETVMDCYYTHVCHGYEIPKHLPENTFKSIIDELNWQYYYRLTTGDVSSMEMGFLLEEIFVNMQKAITQLESNAPYKKFSLFAGHDIGPIMPLMAALESFDGSWAPYASMISIELWEVVTTTNDYYVRVVYNNKEMKLRKCERSICTLKEFTSIVEDIIYTCRTKCFATTE